MNRCQPQEKAGKLAVSGSLHICSNPSHGFLNLLGLSSSSHCAAALMEVELVYHLASPCALLKKKIS